MQCSASTVLGQAAQVSTCEDRGRPPPITGRHYVLSDQSEPRRWPDTDCTVCWHQLSQSEQSMSLGSQSESRDVMQQPPWAEVKWAFTNAASFLHRLVKCCPGWLVIDYVYSLREWVLLFVFSHQVNDDISHFAISFSCCWPHPFNMMFRFTRLWVAFR